MNHRTPSPEGTRSTVLPFLMSLTNGSFSPDSNRRWTTIIASRILDVLGTERDI